MQEKLENNFVVVFKIFIISVQKKRLDIINENNWLDKYCKPASLTIKYLTTYYFVY